MVAIVSSTSEQCPQCNEADMIEEHAHLKCPKCMFVIPCCDPDS